MEWVEWVSGGAPGWALFLIIDLHDPVWKVLILVDLIKEFFWARATEWMFTRSEDAVVELTGVFFHSSGDGGM